jgi:protein-disulfide isomerase-like protein with CxxC motif
MTERRPHILNRVRVTHFSDPGCPWAWSAGPALATLQWRYRDQLEWRHVMIGLTETAAQYERRGYTGEGMAHGYRSFRRRGMPFATEPRERPHATWPMCRVVVAARLLAPEREWSVFRALQFAQFTTTAVLDEAEGLREALAWVPGIDASQLAAASESVAVDEAFRADVELARTAAGGPTEFQGKSATTPDGEVRFTAPSLVFETADGGRLEAGGFQSIEAYDVCIANLAPTLARTPPPDDPIEALARFPEGLTTQEVAAVMAPPLTEPNRPSAESRLLELTAEGRARREQVGDDALWRAG